MKNQQPSTFFACFECEFCQFFCRYGRLNEGNLGFVERRTESLACLKKGWGRGAIKLTVGAVTGQLIEWLN